MDPLTINSKNKWTKANNNKETSYSNKSAETISTNLKKSHNHYSSFCWWLDFKLIELF